MELHIIRGGTREELLAKKYTIAIWVSLGSKWFTAENIIEQIAWSLPLTKDHLVVNVADSIHAINLIVRDQSTYESALGRALDRGKRLLRKVKTEAQKRFSEADYKRIVFCGWQGVVNADYLSKTEYLRELYRKDLPFQESIHVLVKDFISHEERIFTDTEIHQLGIFLLQELPELITRMSIGGVVCDAYVYPFDSLTAQFVEDIQQGKIFPKVKKKIMNEGTKVFLEVR